MKKISIIIPALNEADNIQQTIRSAQTGTNIEIIVVDGGSQDNTVAVAESAGAKIVPSLAGRAVQMNAGAAIASGDILLFLHADTVLPCGFDTQVRQCLGEKGVVAGAFELQIKGEKWGLRLIETGVKWRCRWWQMPYGDQAIFLPTFVFKQLGGFADMPIMEDFELVRRLQRMGKINIIAMPVQTSGRRWQKQGIFKTTAINQMIVVGYLLGVSPVRLMYWYRQGKSKAKF